MKKQLLISSISIATALLILAGCGTDSTQNMSDVNNDILDMQTTIIASAGQSPRFSPGELYELADLVVMGNHSTYREASKSPALSKTYPEHLKSMHKDWVINIKIHSLKVDRYIKGEGPSTIEVVTIVGDPELSAWEESKGEDDATYVLYLHQPLDREFWDNAYFTEGVQGLWKVSVNEESSSYTATQELFSGDQLPLKTLIDSRTGTLRSNGFKSKWDTNVKEMMMNEDSESGPVGNVND